MKSVEPGIPYSIVSDWQVTCGRLAVLTEIAKERQHRKATRS
jgi:hypothetical protein